MEVILASGNRGKLAELTELLAGLPLTLRAQSEFGVEAADESGLSFVENAIIKARHACAATGLPAIADDSGLVVPALGGAPGVLSARYAGSTANDAENLAKLLRALDGVPAAARACSFVCVMVFLRHAADPLPLVATGQWPGRALATPRGTRGFGYDPIFLGVGERVSAAEMPSADKNARSHRGQAVSALVGLLTAELGPR